jgi:hypothetical protein
LESSDSSEMLSDSDSDSDSYEPLDSSSEISDSSSELSNSFSKSSSKIVLGGGSSLKSGGLESSAASFEITSEYESGLVVGCKPDSETGAGGEEEIGKGKEEVGG